MVAPPPASQKEAGGFSTLLKPMRSVVMADVCVRLVTMETPETAMDAVLHAKWKRAGSALAALCIAWTYAQRYAGTGSTLGDTSAMMGIVEIRMGALTYVKLNLGGCATRQPDVNRDAEMVL